MQSGRSEICVLGEDRILGLGMHGEDFSELHCILGQKDVPSGTPWGSIALLSCIHTDIDCVSEVTMEVH